MNAPSASGVTAPSPLLELQEAVPDQVLVADQCPRRLRERHGGIDTEPHVGAASVDDLHILHAADVDTGDAHNLTRMQT